uniref:Uncharacterized protein n=1 Tax=Seriola dumerili TaxID=41447 RepID=A0A3B4TS74_SERDU
IMSDLYFKKYVVILVAPCSIKSKPNFVMLSYHRHLRSTEQTNTRLQESQNKPTEAFKTEQEEVPCNLLTDLLCNDENDPTQFTFSCEVGEGHSSNGDGARSPERNSFPDSSKQHPSFICTAPKFDLSPLENTTTVFLTGADYPGEEGSVQVPITVEVKTEADEQTPNTASPTSSLLNMPSPSPEWFTIEDSDLKPPVDAALQRAAESEIQVKYLLICSLTK